MDDKDFIKNSLLFDAEWYCRTYGFGKYFDAAGHYLNVGWREGKDPSAFFSTADYLKKNPDVEKAGINPLLHFEQNGVKEKRYRDEIKAALPAILTRHPECRGKFDGGLIRIRITNACNAKCRYCGARLFYGEELKNSITPNWLYEICKPLYDSANIILITGGDAFFAKESYRYMNFLSDNFPKITIMTETNGIAFNEKFQNLACKNLFHVHISLNASNAEIFAKSCWEPDDSDTAKKMYAMILRNIQNYISKLQAENKIYFAPDYSMVINKDNYFDVGNFVELALKLHAPYVMFFFDYIENNMNDDYFKNRETSRYALKTLMELERVLVDKFFVYFRLWVPQKEVEELQPEVEATPLIELERKYAKILELAKNRSMLREFQKRNAIRRANGKTELTLAEDFTPTIHLQENTEKPICFAPWNELDLYPNGRIDFCGWFEETINIKDYIDAENNYLNWDAVFNSFEYISARYRILHDDFRGCQSCCPMNSVKSPIVPPTKYNLDRATDKKICACCGEEIKNYLPIDQSYIDTMKENGVNFNFRYEMLNLREYTCPNCESADRERAYALVMKKILPTDKEIHILDIAPRKCIADFVKKNFPLADYKTADLFMPETDYKLDIMDMNQIAEGSIDFFICSHVLEHVTDDIKAMQELKRILADDGCGILVVPLDLNKAKIDEDPNCTDVAERWRRFGQDDHIRAYTKEIFLQRLESVGLKVEQFDKEFFGAAKMAENGLIESSVVYVVRK